MVTLLPELIIGPLLVGGSTLVCRLWGAERAGVVSAFPAVVGLVLLIVAQEHGAVFAARAPLTGELDPTHDLALRMALTAMLVLALASAASLVGPLVGGMLAALPALASVLAVFTHRRQGPRAVIAMLRGMVVGMAGFVAFCAAVSALIVPLGTAAAFAAAAVAAASIQGLVSAPQLLRRLTTQPRERSVV